MEQTTREKQIGQARANIRVEIQAVQNELEKVKYIISHLLNHGTDKTTGRLTRKASVDHTKLANKERKLKERLQSLEFHLEMLGTQKSQSFSEPEYDSWSAAEREQERIEKDLKEIRERSQQKDREPER